MAQKVLIADDGLASRLLFEKVLTREGYDVITVGSGTEVVDRVKEKQPDIALIDAIMPEVDGYQICETLKNHPNFKNLPIILLTGQHENIDRDRGIDLVGSSAILSKPAKSAMIISKVKEMLETQKAEPAPTATEQIPEAEVIEEPPFVEEGYEFDEDSEEADLVVESEILDEEIESEIFEEEEEIEEIEEFAEEEYEAPEPEAQEEVFQEEVFQEEPPPPAAKTPVVSAPEGLGDVQVSDEKLDLIADEIARRVAGKLIPAMMQELANSFMQLPAIKDVVENTSKNLVKDLLKDKS